MGKKLDDMIVFCLGTVMAYYMCKAVIVGLWNWLFQL